MVRSPFDLEHSTDSKDNFGADHLIPSEQQLRNSLDGVKEEQEEQEQEKKEK